MRLLHPQISQLLRIISCLKDNLAQDLLFSQRVFPELLLKQFLDDKD